MRLRSIDMCNTFVFGCLHLGQNKTFVYRKRGFQSMAEHDAAMVESLMSTPKGCNLISLGDMFYSKDYDKALATIKVLTEDRTLFLFEGDLDHRISWKLFRDESAKVVKMGDVCLLKDSHKEKIVLSHYPLESWPEMSVRKHLHAHTHGMGSNVRNRFDCSAESLLKEFGSPVVNLVEILNKVDQGVCV